MNTLLIKFVITCFVCEFIGHIAGVPLKDAHNRDHKTRIIRSPADNFSFFGVKTPSAVSNPIKHAEKVLNSFGSLFTPVSATRKHDKPLELQNANYDNKLKENTTNLTPTRNINKNSESSTLDMSVKSSMPNVGFHKHDTNTINQLQNAPNGDKPLESVNSKSDTFNKQNNDTNKINEDVSPIDKEVIDSIFEDLKNDHLNDITSTTEDSTLEYTTETGEYDLTTIDDLLRIPAPVLATLLGK